MAYHAKTKVEPVGIDALLAAVPPAQRQAEARTLVALFQDVTRFAPRVQTGGMIGFGRYAHTYASGHSGVSFATGFAPRKAELSIHILPGYQDFGPILARPQPHRLGKGCLYLRHPDQVDQAVLAELIAAGLADLGRRWPITPGRPQLDIFHVA